MKAKITVKFSRLKITEKIKVPELPLGTEINH